MSKDHKEALRLFTAPCWGSRHQRKSCWTHRIALGSRNSIGSVTGSGLRHGWQETRSPSPPWHLPHRSHEAALNGIFYTEGGETLEWVAQRGGRCPIPGNIQGQAGQRSLIQLEMSLLTAGGWAGWPLKVPSSPKHSMVLWHPSCLLLPGRWIFRWASVTCRQISDPRLPRSFSLLAVGGCAIHAGQGLFTNL